MNTFSFGTVSEKELVDVHPKLVFVVRHALRLSTQDFAVHDGLRTEEEQKKLLASGASKTMKSKHLRQSDGFGHATDLVPYINGKMRWEWSAIYPIALAMRSAAKDLGTTIRWGGMWSCLNTTTETPEDLVNMYVEMRVSQHKPAFVDGPHFELMEG